MYLKALKCPNCHGDISIEPGEASIHCPFCSSNLIIDKKRDTPEEQIRLAMGIELEKARAESASLSSKARECYQQENHEEAARLWDAALSANGQNDEAFYGLLCVRCAHAGSYMRVSGDLQSPRRLNEIKDDNKHNLKLLAQFSPEPFSEQINSLVIKLRENMRQLQAAEAQKKSVVFTGDKKEGALVNFGCLGSIVVVCVCFMLAQFISPSFYTGVIIGAIVLVLSNIAHSKLVKKNQANFRKKRAPYVELVDQLEEEQTQLQLQLQQLCDASLQ